MSRLLLAPATQWIIVVAWVLVGLVSLSPAIHIDQALDAAAHLGGSESAKVAALLAQRFQSPFTEISLLRISGVVTPRDAEGRALLDKVVTALRHSPRVQDVMSYLDRDDSLFIAEDGSPLVIVGLNTRRDASEGSMAALRTVTDALQRESAGQFPAIGFGWTGQSAVNADMRRLSTAQTRAAELRILPLTLLILLVAFRSVLAAALPLVCGALTILVSLGTVAALNRYWPASLIVVSIISMVGLGLSIDYALLIVSRYRDGLGAGLSHAQAVVVAAERGSRTVVVSGTAVAIGFAAMLLVHVSEIKSIGIGGLVVTIVAVAVASTLLPVMLARVGPWLQRAAPAPRGSGLWRAWATWVVRHPWPVAVVTGVPLLLLAAHAAQLRIDLPRGRWLPESAESVRVLHDIDAVSKGDFGEIVQVILEFPPGVTLNDEAGWRAEKKLAVSFARDPRIQHVWAATTLSTVPLTGPEILKKIPESARRTLVSEDGEAAVLQLLPKRGVTAVDAAALVREIRAKDVGTLTGVPGTRLIVGGVPGFNVDYEDAIGKAIGTVVICVIVATLVVLSLAFRSVLIPIKAVALNLLSVGAAFGAVTWVFQEGHGARLMGLPGPMDGGFPIIPITVFCIVFGLSMDYEVFIVARVADGRRSGLSEENALIEGLITTGRVVSFAAAIMVAVFASFISGEFVLIKILGFALSVAVILDATVVRLALGPALLRLAGRWNWWPGR